ncbi:trk system potassium uptake protein TrkA [Sphaerotilus sulfidivorans]|jgi:trk system potassium uptake protein TrkA|uniref:Trk system potassium uptake protein TrkA n=1 Tax=Sphaerotilus sulfidivorans TaxID=639200 RepID=A0A5C1Q6I4_9BURK|nr:Trk system potassium transporter TrkA [Sphaerotilus sulfidivorans]NZD47182.1 Trk system potassium transporter TrkA [Sphaerotilus sulfidivorans]QEN02446.1 Trk system potassium transporter TrkA [Sphaerotilus sulfidivorans]
MNILIIGAGRVGTSVAEHLVSERNDITVIDTDPQRLRDLQERLDLRGVCGNAIQPSVLREAGAEDCDLLVACAPQDETNLTVCKVAHDLFNVTTSIARLRSPEFVEGAPLLAREGGFAVDHVICPEQSVTTYIRKLVEYPEALRVIEFAGGRVTLAGVRAGAGSRLVGHRLDEIPTLVPNLDMRVVGLFRREQPLKADGSTRIEAGDEAFVLTRTAAVTEVLCALRERDRPVRRVMIAGGGKVGLRLARELRGRCEIRLIELDRQRCEYLAAELGSEVLVLHGDATDEELMTDANVGETDVFIALSSDDEDNILSGLLSKRLGARRAIVLINRRAYTELVQGTQIDVAISPQHAVIGELLAYVRRGDVEAVHSMRQGAAESLEIIARGDRRSSKVVSRRIEQIDLPEGVQIGAIVRGDEVIMAHHDTVIQTDDHVIVFLPSKRQVRAVEKLFQVGATFF